MRINYILIGGLVGLAINLVAASSHAVRRVSDTYGSHLAESKPLNLRIETFKRQNPISPAHNAALDYWAHAYLADPTNEWTRKVLDSLLGSPNIVRKCLIDLFAKLPPKYRNVPDIRHLSSSLVTITDLAFLALLDRAMRWTTDLSDWDAITSDILLWTGLSIEKRQERFRALRSNFATVLITKYKLKPTEAARAGVGAGVPAELAREYEAILTYASNLPAQTGYYDALLFLAEHPDYIAPIAALIPSLTIADWEAIVAVMGRFSVLAQFGERTPAEIELGHLLTSRMDAIVDAAAGSNLAI